jgi:hypothetical protein
MATSVSTSEHAPITFTTTSTIVEPKKRGRAKKNAPASTTTTINTTTITITPKFIEVDKSGHGHGSDDASETADQCFKNEIVSPEESNTSDSKNASNIENEALQTAANPMHVENDDDDDGLYKLSQFNYDILIPFILINMHASSRSNILALLHTTLVSCIEGRCISEGFIKPETVRIVDFKCGKIVAKNVQFNLVIECYVCNPLPNATINCIANNITQAGIRAISNDDYLPVIIYISRDYSMLTQNTYYNTIKEGDKIAVRVIGKRFEMNDKFIQIIGELVAPKKERTFLKTPKKSNTITSITSLGSIGEVVTTSTSSSTSTTTPTTTPAVTIPAVTTPAVTIPATIVQKETKASKAPKETKATKEPKEPKAAKEPKALKEPKMPKAPKEPKEAKKSIKSNVDA